MLYEMTGTIKLINDMMSFPSGFTKRQFVLTSEDDRFPQDIAMAFTKDRCAILDNVKPGERVKVTFGLRGREWNGKYFVDVDALKLEKLDETGGSDESDSDFPVDNGVPVNDADDGAMPF